MLALAVCRKGRSPAAEIPAAIDDRVRGRPVPTAPPYYALAFVMKRSSAGDQVVRGGCV
jgi:hypothetical protein